MTILLVVGSMILGIVLFVVFSNVYLEIASKRARARRERARRGAPNGIHRSTEHHEDIQVFEYQDYIAGLGAELNGARPIGECACSKKSSSFKNSGGAALATAERSAH